MPKQPTIHVRVLKNRLPALVQNLEQTVGQIGWWTTSEVANKMRERMGGPGPNIPSAPGQAPARQTSDLFLSILARRINDMEAEVSMLEYGIYLNYGTATVEPRPFIEPSIDEVRREIPGYAARAIRKIVE